MDKLRTAVIHGFQTVQVAGFQCSTAFTQLLRSAVLQLLKLSHYPDAVLGRDT